ncbi:MAG: InlB B-repeat-containing protein [Clostridia bacterium]|nr:InlB B-repeat-containing protein [Clostridia bacterium]
MILLAAAGVIYAIVIGIRFVKAEDKSGRDEAKAKLLYTMIGVGVTLVLIAFFLWLSMLLKDKDSSLNKEVNNLLPTGWSVVYDEDRGSSVSDASGLEIGDTITLAKAPTKEGFTFKGWKNKETDATLEAEAKYKIAEEDDKDGDEKIELVAVWEAVAAGS